MRKHIGDVWGKLLQHDTSVMQHVDEVTVKALELRELPGLTDSCYKKSRLK